MQMNLRKANGIQNELSNILNSLVMKYGTDVRVSIYDNAEDTIQQASAELFENIARRGALLDALYEIRKLVSEVNQTGGISLKLADIARLDRDIEFYDQLQKADPVELDKIKKKLEKIESASPEAQSNYHYREDVTTGILSEEKIEEFAVSKAEAARAKRKLQDELLELNIKTEITLSDATENVLKAERLI